MKMKLLTVIITYDRPIQFGTLTTILRADLPEGSDIIAFHDGPARKLYKEIVLSPGIQMFSTEKHHGRRGHWELWDLVFTFLKAYEAEYTHVLFLPDDVLPTDGWYSDLMDYWYASGKDPRRIAIRPIIDRRGIAKNWTAQEPIMKHFELAGPEVLPGAVRMWQTNWIDGLFMCTKRLLQEMEWRIDPIGPSWLDRPGVHSSGVGRQLTQRINSSKKHLHVWQTDTSLFTHLGEHESKMHPEHRKDVPL